MPLHNSGKVSRDFIYVEDVVRGLVACAEKGEAREAYNLTSGVETTIFNLTKIINKN